MRKGIIFSDIDGTFCFHEDFHGVDVIGRNPDGTVNVRTAADTTCHRAYDLSNNKYQVYMAVSTYKLFHLLSSSFEIVLVTGARLATIAERYHSLDFADAFILENGGMIVDNLLEPVPEWSAHISPQLEILHCVESEMHQAGLAMDNAGRKTAIRIRHRDNLHLSPAEFEALPGKLDLPDSLRITRNLHHIDILPVIAGKKNAVSFYLERDEYRFEEAIGIGDDVNDLEFLRLVGKPYVLSSALPDVLAEARRKCWLLSDEPHFSGINSILAEISERASESDP